MVVICQNGAYNSTKWHSINANFYQSVKNFIVNAKILLRNWKLKTTKIWVWMQIWCFECYLAVMKLLWNSRMKRILDTQGARVQSPPSPEIFWTISKMKQKRDDWLKKMKQKRDNWRKWNNNKGDWKKQ